MKTLSLRRQAPFALVGLTFSGAVMAAPILAPAVAQSAQKRPNPLAIRTQKRVASLFQIAAQSLHELNLSSAQQLQLKKIAQKNTALMREVWSGSSLSQQKKMSRLRALQDEAGAVLTAPQKEKLASLKSEAMLGLIQTAGWVSGELQLTSQQQSRIQSIAMQSLQKSRGAAGNFGALREVMLDANGQINAVLTPAQRTKWNVIRGAARSEFAKNARVLRTMSGV